MNKTYRECAIEHLKQGNLCKGYVDYIVGEVEKLEKIEEIITKYQDTLDTFYGSKPRDLLESDVLRDIKEVLEKE